MCPRFQCCIPLIASVPVLTVMNPADAEGPLNLVTWNVESGGATPDAISVRISAMDGIDLWGLSEVASVPWATTFEQAAEDGESGDFNRVLGTTGGADRLLILYDDSRFQLVRSEELHDINIGGNVRAPLVAHLRERQGGFEFLFVVNHLYRSNETARHNQARMLNQWAAGQTHPVIAVGDFNFDWSVTNGENDHDSGFDNLVANDVFTWIRPATLIRTQDSEHDSVLDFVFVAHPQPSWTMTSTIIVEPTDFPNDNTTPDHRPVRADIGAGAIVGETGPLRQLLLERIAALEAELAAIKVLVEQMEH